MFGDKGDAGKCLFDWNNNNNNNNIRNKRASQNMNMKTYIAFEKTHKHKDVVVCVFICSANHKATQFNIASAIFHPFPRP